MTIDTHIRPRRLGLHGVRAAGKTCFLGSLYGFRADEAGQVAFADDATVQYLAAVWRDLSNGRVPGATPLAAPTDLHLELELPGRPDRVRLELSDYAGQLVQPRTDVSSPVAHALTEDVRAWLRGCHAVLIFIDSARPDIEQMDAIDLLLTDLRGRAGAATPERPVGLVLTKWDCHGPVGADAAAEEGRAREFLAAHPVLRQVHDKLSEIDGDRVRLFPVSSFGNHAAGSVPPPVHLYRPCHLLAPLAWAAAASDAVLLEDARAVARGHMARAWRVLGLPVWPRPDHAAARRVWQEVRDGYGGGRGELAAAADREMEAVNAVRRNHWARNTLAALVVAAGLFGLLHQGRAEASQLAEAVDQFHETHPDPGQAAERLERTARFVDSWWSWLVPSTRRTMLERLREDRLVLQEQEDRPGTLARAVELEKRQEWAELAELCRDFLERYPMTPARVAVEQALDKARELLDRRAALAEGQRLEANGEIDRALGGYRTFVRRYPKSPARADFADRIRTAERVLADRTEYEALRQLAGRRDGTSLEAAGRRARAYLGSSQPTRLMRRPVERFWAWFDGLQKGGRYEIIVTSLVIPSSSALDPLFGTAEPRVHVTLGDTTHTTPWLRGTNLTPGERLGPYRFRWGEPTTLLVRVESYRRVLSNQWSRGEVSEARFALGEANGSIVTRCSKGKAVLVGLRCAAARPPELPPYGRH